MSAIANITVFDGAGTPVSHTLTAISVSRKGDDVLAEWREVNASIPAYASVRASVKLSLLKSGVYKAEARVVVPVMEAVTNQNAAGYTAAPKVAYENTFILTMYAHQRSTVTDRRIAKQIMCNLLNNVSTSVAAATSGPVPDLFDSLITPT